MNIPLNIDWQQILLHLMNFAILGGGLYFLLYRPVKRFMDRREAFYQEQADKAAQTAKDAEDLKTQAQQELDRAQEQLMDIRRNAQAEAHNAAQQQLEDARKQAEKILADAQTQAVRSRDKMMADARQAGKEMAVEAAEKLVLQSDGDAFDRFLELAGEEGGKDEQH